MSRLRSLCLAVLAALLLVACGGTPTGGQSATPAADATAPAAQTVGTGGTLRIGRTTAPDSLNPGASYLIEAGEIQSLVYDTLIGVNLRNEPIPQLAREWSLADDQKTWTFKLHEGAKWHDGQPVTAEDVAFTYNMIAGFESFGLLGNYVTLLDRVEVVDPTTVVIAFSEPVANTDERFSSIYILPRHIWEQFADAQAAAEFTNDAMVGSGPFKLAEYKQGEFTRLTAVKDHYLSPPKVDEVVVRVFGNGDAMVQALRTGELDLIGVPSATVVKSLQAEQNIKVEIGEQLGLTDIIFNVTDPANCPPDVGKCTGHPALRDVKVRQALAHATDKQQLIDVVLLGLGSPGLGLVMPGHGDAYAAQLQDYAYDPERARQILEEAGYRDSDGDGVREMPDDPSQPLSFRYNYPSDQSTSGARIFELLSEMWQQVGVQINLTPLEADALTAVCCPAFDFDVIQWGWGAGVDPASLIYILNSEEIPTGVSETGYANPEYDALYKEQLITPDRARRRELLHRMQEIALRDVPYIIPFYSKNVEAYRSDRFGGWVIEPAGRLNLIDRSSLTVVGPVQ